MIVLHTIIYPIVEYGVHYTLHKIKNKFHNEHHLSKKLSREYWCINCIIICLIFRFYSVSSMFLRYWLVHQFIHHNPNSSYSRHHMIHHKYNNCNYGVSCKWVDQLMGTCQNPCPKQT